jgi:hypothetical protein
MDEIWIVNRFTDHIHVGTTNIYNTADVSTLYSSLEHTVSVTRSFLLTVPTMAIPLPSAQVLSSQSVSQSQSHIATHGSQSVCLGVEPRLGLMTRCFFLFESYCPVHVGRPL